jgi:hypothetical protein
MRALRRRVFEFDVSRWAQDFLRALADAGTTSQVVLPGPQVPGDDLTAESPDSSRWTPLLPASAATPSAGLSTRTAGAVPVSVGP